MTLTMLENKDVDIGFSEPWELSEKLEKDNLIGTIVNVGTNINKYYHNEEECLIVTLKKEFDFNGMDCKHFVVSPRHKDTGLKNLLHNKKINCSFIRISQDQITSNNPFDTSWWRGSGSFVATIKLT